MGCDGHADVVNVSRRDVWSNLSSSTAKLGFVHLLHTYPLFVIAPSLKCTKCGATFDMHHAGFLCGVNRGVMTTHYPADPDTCVGSAGSASASFTHPSRFVMDMGETLSVSSPASLSAFAAALDETMNKERDRRQLVLETARVTAARAAAAAAATSSEGA